MKGIKIEVKIEKVQVDEGYYTIDYKYKVNSNAWKSGVMNEDYDNGMSDKEWKKVLEDGGAMEYVLQKIVEEPL